MSYITISDLEARYSTEVTDLCGDMEDTEKTTYLNSVIEGSQGIIDGYLSERHQTPVENPNSLIKEFCLSIVIYKLFQSAYGADIPEKIKEPYKETLKQLKDVTAGKMNIPNAVKSEENSNSFFMVGSEEDAVFSDLKGF